MVCIVPGCSRQKKRSKCYGKHNQVWWCFGKYCSMHYERLRQTGQFGGVKPKHNPAGTPWLGSNGYLKITHNGKETYVHRLVWEHYNGPIPSGYHIHHRDENKRNNRISNLALSKEDEHLAYHATKTINALSQKQRYKRIEKAIEARKRTHEKRPIPQSPAPACR